MHTSLEELHESKARLLGKPEARDLKQLEDIYHRHERGRYLGDFVFGANDGIITTFAIVAGATGAAFSPVVVIILGFANLFADGISMGIGNYLGKKSEREYFEAQKKKEEWEVEHFREIELDEIRHIFSEWGFEGQDLDRVVEVVSKNRDVWVDLMMHHELGIKINPHEVPAKHGLATFISFFVAGFVPLIPFVAPFFPHEALFPFSTLFTGVALFSVGALRSLVNPVSWVKGGFEILIVGSVAAITAYGVGVLLHGILNGIII